jgi:hypothetical protein
VRSGFRRNAAPVGAALVALLPLAASPANYIDADLQRSHAWIAAGSASKDGDSVTRKLDQLLGL